MPGIRTTVIVFSSAALASRTDGAYGCCSSAIRYRVTTVLLKASLGSEQVPVNEVANGVVVRALRAWGCEAIENCGSGRFQIRKSQNCFGVAIAFRFGHAGIFCRINLRS